MAREVSRKPGSRKGTPGKAAGPAKAKVVKKALKRPTGELSKSNSDLAKFIKGSASGKGFTKAEARTAAGKYRDMANAKGGKFRSLDESGVALGKAEAATKKMRKPAAKPAARGAKAGSSIASKVANRTVKRVKTIAREVRDVPTSVANAVSMYEANLGPNTKSGSQGRRMLKDIAKQTGEAVRSAATGKKGTAPLKVTPNRKDRFYGAMTNREYVAKQAKPGKKR
jgi:hypothetical protein